MSTLAISLLGPQENLADVGTMNARVASDTRRALRREDVCRHVRHTRCGVWRWQVTLQADCVYIRLNQQLGIRPPVREVAADATFSLNRSVLIDEGSGHQQVAFGAHDELPSSRRQRILAKSAVRIVAVCTFDQPLFNLVMGGHGELRLDVAVALEAELGLLHLEQMLRRAGCMDDVATRAAHTALPVDRALKACALAAMACLAFFIHLFSGGRGGVEDHGDSAALRVRLAGTVTALAGHAFALMRQRRQAVRIVGKVLHDLFVTGRADSCVAKVA